MSRAGRALARNGRGAWRRCAGWSICIVIIVSHAVVRIMAFTENACRCLEPAVFVQHFGKYDLYGAPAVGAKGPDCISVVGPHGQASMRNG